jgi:hypothetical protein
MYVMFDGDTPHLEDIDNFRALKVVVAAGELPPLQLVGRVDGDHVWLDQAWLQSHGRPADPAWARDFAGMIGYAAKSGWVDAAGGVRAHIENAPAQ